MLHESHCRSGYIQNVAHYFKHYYTRTITDGKGKGKGKVRVLN